MERSTESREDEQNQRDQIALMRAIIEHLPTGIFAKDAQGRFTLVNRAWIRSLGLPAEQVVGKTVHEIYPPEMAQRFAAEDAVLLAQGASAQSIESMRTGPRPNQFRVVRKAVLARDDGSVQGLISSSTDISELKHYEHELADRAKFISELVDALPIMVAMRDVEGRYVLVNRTWERITGVRREDALGRRRREFPGWRGDARMLRDAEEIERADLELLARGPNFITEPRAVNRLGHYYLMTRRVLADSEGAPVGVLSAGMDLTERRALEEARALEQQRLELVVRATKVGTLDWDARTRTFYYSPRLKEILGYAPDADTADWPELFTHRVHPEDSERASKVYQECVSGTGTGGTTEHHDPMEYRVRRADESYVWVEAQGVVVRDAAGLAARYIATYTDITARREQEDALRQSVRLREEVERMSRHDLKTPINSVVAMSRLLREGGRVAPEDMELLATIERAGYRILNMVNLSLDLFRMETGSYQFDPRAVDLAQVVRRVAADLESQAASKNIDLRVRANGASAATNVVLARGDELLCYSMFANLVKNAIEAAPAGATVSIHLRAQADAVFVEVHNPGAVPEAIRGNFFEKYATTGKRSGLGLGTYSARLMARVQGGELSLNTSDENGTTLTARFQTADARLQRASESRATESERVEEQRTMPALRVLVVDDDEFNRLVLRRYLPSPPLSVAFVVNGRAALDAAAREWPDVILMDLEMPVMDGYEAARRVRAMERDKNLKRCLIVAISSNNEPAIAQRALAAGCDRYIVKPAPRQVLWNLLSGSADWSNDAGEFVDKAATEGSRAMDAVTVDEDLRPVLPEFLRTRRELLEELQAALTAGDRALAQRLAHRIAGSLAIYGFKWAAAEVRAIEDDAAHDDAADPARRVAGLRAYLDSVVIEYAPVSGLAAKA